MEGFCRGCLKKYNDPADLLQYCEGNRRMFVYSTGIQVKRNDSFTFQLCKECFLNMKSSCKFKKLCRASDRKFKDYLSLKEDEESTDFSTYLKNTENTLTLKLPTASANNTPAHQKNREDDNDSTCTSIRNFMTDILQDEEVPATEAQIIREVIQEEADILDDSLDSHWMQDDMSIVSEFEDFNFSTFSTPAHSISNYTPRKLEEKERNLNYYTPNRILESSPNTRNFTDRVEHDNDMPILDDINFKTPNHEFPNYIADIVNTGVDKEKQNLINKPDLTQTNMLEQESDYKALTTEEPPFENNTNLYIPSEDVSDSFAANVEISIPDMSKTIDKDINKHQVNKTSKDKVIRVKSFASKDTVGKSVFQSPFSQELEHYISKSQEKVLENDDQSKFENNNIKETELELYINKAKLKQKSKQNNQRHKDRHDCTIDRNLEMALENKNNTEISLDQLIMTPQGNSGASTPTIRNILFGSMTPKEQDITNTGITNDEENSKLDIEQFLKTQPVIQSKGKDIDLMEQLVKDENDDDSSGMDDVKEEKDDEIESEPNDTNKEKDTNQEWDINVSHLLEMEDNEGDLNFSISSDFLEDKSTIEPFKRPISPDKSYNLEDFSCKLCPKTYDSVRALKVHFAKFHNMKIVTPKVKRVYNKVCDICGKKFNAPSNLYKHMKKHIIPEKNYKCNVCSQYFPTQNGLRKHMYWHKNKQDRLVATSQSKEKKYICSVCGKSHNGLGNLKVHMARHSHNYSFECNQCGKGFYRTYDLTVHLRSHTNEKPYNCDICPKTFRKRFQLANHLKRHLETYKCDTCEVIFPKKYLIRRHLQTGVCPQNLMRPIKFRKKQMPLVNIIENTGVTISYENMNYVIDKKLETPTKSEEDNSNDTFMAKKNNETVLCGSSLDILL